MIHKSHQSSQNSFGGHMIEKGMMPLLDEKEEHTKQLIQNKDISDSHD